MGSRIWFINRLGIMIIDIVDKVYEIDSNRGITAIEDKNLLFKLNSIIEWKFCNFPHKFEKDENGKQKDLGPDLDYLGTPPELKPGNVFLYNRQLISVGSKERLVLSLSETGFNALKRVFNSEVMPEIEMNFNEFIPEIEWEAVEEDTIPEHYKTFNTNYNLHNIWRNKFGLGRNIFSPKSGEICIKVKVSSENLITPTTIYMLPWTIKYDPKVFGTDEEYIELTMFEVFSYFYEEYERLKLPEKK